ncbi:lysophospholipid acyltransferase family protein [Jatrophihabitans fulvus]
MDARARWDAVAQRTARVARRIGVETVRRYNRLEIDTSRTVIPDDPVLFVANHGFGGVVDLNVSATLAALDRLQLDRPVTILVHQIAWTLGVGPVLEALDARPASATAAHDAFAAGHHVLVFPGGDIEAGRSFADRNKITFGDRTGFARLARDEGVPIVPVVTAGAGESLLVLNDGRRLARLLRLDRTLRLKAMPVTLSVPWGLNVGVVGLVPYLPLPTKLRTRVLAPIAAPADDSEAQIAGRVTAAMQRALTELTSNRRPVIG